MTDQNVGLSRGSSKHKQFIQNSANNYVVEAFIDVSAVAPGSGLPAAADGQQYTVDAGSSSPLGAWGTITGLQDKDIIRYRASKSQWERVFAAAAGEEGAKVYDKDSDTIFAFDGADWNIASGAGGGAKNFAQRQATGYKVGDLTSGNSAIFGDSGTLDGALSIDTAVPLEGKKSWQYTTGGSSENDWFYYTVDISSYARGGVLAFVFDYLWDGEQPIQVKILDENDNELTTELNQITNTDNINKNSKNSRTVFVQAQDQATVRVGLQVPAGVTSGKILKWDNLLVSDDIGVIGSSGGERIVGTLAIDKNVPNFVNPVSDIRWFPITSSDLSSTFLNTNPNGLFTTIPSEDGIQFEEDCTLNASYTIIDDNTIHTYFIRVFESTGAVVADTGAVVAESVNAWRTTSANIKVKKGQIVKFAMSNAAADFIPLYARINLVAEAINRNEGLRFLQVPNGEKLRNDFGVVLDTGGNIVSKSGGDWIDSISFVNAGDMTINIKPGIFSVPPLVKVTHDGFERTSSFAQQVTSSSIRVRQFRTDTGVFGTGYTTLQVEATKQGLDSDSVPDIIGVPVSIQGQTHEQDSAIWLAGGNGYGSVDTSKRRFSNIISTRGNSLTYIDDSQNGAKIIVNENGLYHCSYSEITTNSTNVDMHIVASGISAPVAVGSIGAESGEYRGSVSGTVYLPKGTELQIFNAGTLTTNNGDLVTSFKVAKVGTQPLLDGGVVESPGSFIELSTRIGGSGSLDLLWGNIVSQVNNGDFTYDPATGKMTVLNSGHYAMSVTDEVSGAGELSVRVNGVSKAVQRLSDSLTRHSVCWSGWLFEGDVIVSNSTSTRGASGYGYLTFAKRDNIQQYTSRVYKEDPIAYQTKFVSGITSDGLVSGLTFNNLELGKTYRIYGRMYTDGNSVSANQGAFLLIQHNGVNIQSPSIGSVFGTSPDRRHSFHFDEVFTASATTLEAVMSLVQNSSSSIRWTLEELPFHAQTTKWT